MKSITREAAEQLRSARSRNHTGRADGFLYEADQRLNALQRALNAAEPTSASEIQRHIPVSSVAALESQFKAIVMAIVDSGPEYLERGLRLIRDSLKPSSQIVVEMLHRKSLSVGELVAYALPFNSLANVERALGELLDGDLKAMIGSTVDPYRVRNNLSPQDLMVADNDALWRDLNLTFERRHVLAHEAASKFEITREQAQTAITSVRTMSAALDALLWNTAWRLVPLTQREMNDDVWKTYLSTRRALVANLRRAREIAREDDEQLRFRKLYLALARASALWAAWNEEAWSTGSIRPMMAALARDTAVKSRVDTLRGWISSHRPEESA